MVMTRFRVITVVILTKNEAHQLERCLGAIPKGYRVVVLDSGSDDETVSLAAKAGCDVYQQSWLGFAEQRNHALSHCDIDTPWVLFIDADEIYPESFYSWFETEFQNDPKVDVVMVPSFLVLKGKKLLHAPGYPIYHPRMVRSETRPFVQGHAGHTETVSKSARLAYAPIAYDHYFFQGDMSAWMQKHVRLGVMESDINVPQDGAVTMRARLSLLLGRSFLRIPARFLYHFVFGRGFLDGRAGFEYSLMYAWYEATKYLLNVSVRSDG
jgi:glycosyltransferase involved in cell wall biosynthesis